MTQITMTCSLSGLRKAEWDRSMQPTKLWISHPMSFGHYVEKLSLAVNFPTTLEEEQWT